MRTTLDVEEDVLHAATAIAQQRGVSIGKGLSELARQALSHRRQSSTRNNVPLFAVQPEAGIVTLELVNRLRDESA